MEKSNKEISVSLPEGKFCGSNCADDCRYWNPRDRNDEGRQWCNYYNTYYFPNERNGCINYKAE